MFRKIICTLLAGMLVVSMIAIAAICVSADNNKNSENSLLITDETLVADKTEPVEETATTVQTSSIGGTTDVSGETVPATTEDPLLHTLNLTVNATSNYFPETSAQYNPNTNEVTVTYNIKSTRDLLDTQWYLTYDPEILKVSDKTTLDTISPMTGVRGVQFDKSMIEDGVGYVKFSASNIRLFDISSESMVYATIVFDVKDILKVAPISTTVDLVVEVLRVSQLAPEGAVSAPDKEVLLIDNEIVLENSKTALVKVQTSTVITQSTYVEPTTAEPTTTQETTVDSSSTAADETGTDPSEATTEPTDIATTTQSMNATGETAVPVTDATSITGATGGSKTEYTVDNKTEENIAVVQTGDPSLAAIILVLLIVATCIMFVVRKKEMYF